MKKISIAIFLIVIFMPNVQAGDYTLKRVVITWAGALVDDSALGPFRASGSMNINGQVITQNITFCQNGTCEKMVENSSGTIVNVTPGTEKVSIRLHEDGTVGDLTLLTLSPNIITMFVYDDGTAETHEWQPVNAFTKIANEIPETANQAIVIGKIGRGVANKLRPDQGKQ